MFTATESTHSDYNFEVTPVGAGIVNLSGVFGLNDNASGNVSVKATHKVQKSVTATHNIVATPKLMRLVASQVTNVSIVGAPENPLATDSITITDPAQPGVVRFDGVPQGALTGKLMYDVEGTDAGLMELSLSGQVLTITLSGPITSEDTKVTMRTDPASTIFRTYIVKSGA